jgi:serine/threonine-protein kinase RsbW
VPATVLLKVPATLAYRQIACRTVSAVCKLAQEAEGSHCASVERRQTNELMSAVGEAFNNVVIHAYAGSVDGVVELELSWDREHVVVEMRDTGMPFDLDAVPMLDLDRLHEGGMGVFIMRSFADHVEYRPGSPNVLVLEKRVGGVGAKAGAAVGRRGHRRAAGG